MGEALNEDDWRYILAPSGNDDALWDLIRKHLSRTHTSLLEATHLNARNPMIMDDKVLIAQHGIARQIVLRYISAVRIGEDRAAYTRDEEALRLAQEANDIAKAANKHADRANLIAWGAAGIAAISAAVAILLGG